MALATPKNVDIGSTLTGPKDSGPVNGPSGTAGVAPGFNQGRISGMLDFQNQMDANKMENPLNSALSGNLVGTTDTGGSDANAPASFQGITVEPPHLPPGAVPAANEQP